MKPFFGAALGLVLFSLSACVAVPVDRNLAAEHDSVRAKVDNFREDSAKANRDAVRDPSK